MVDRKVVIITGASDGIGAAAARRLSRHGHEVVVVGRSAAKTQQVAQSIGAESFLADFASLEEVRALAAQLLTRYPRIDVLANNAGGVFGTRTRTVDGFERTFQVNHLAPFLLTNLLMDRLAQSRASVIQTASIASVLFGRLDLDDLDNDRRFSANRAYGDSKLENILFTSELHRRHHRDGISAVAFHPGFIRSGFAADTTSLGMRLTYATPVLRRALRTPDQGAEPLVWFAETEPGTTWKSGRYYSKQSPARLMHPKVRNASIARRLWDRSTELVGL